MCLEKRQGGRMRSTAVQCFYKREPYNKESVNKHIECSSKSSGQYDISIGKVSSALNLLYSVESTKI